MMHPRGLTRWYLYGCVVFTTLFVYASVRALLSSGPTSIDSKTVELEEAAALLGGEAYPPPCSFRHLQSAWGRSSPNDFNSDGSCWSLKDVILRVPVSSIEQRDNLQRIGDGHSGSISLAQLCLPNESSCSAIIKTDRCILHPGWWGLLYDKLWDTLHVMRPKVSCVHTRAMLQFGTSYLGAEYTGALLHYSHLFSSSVRAKGTLPTWGVVVDESSTLYSHSYHGVQGGPHSDPSIVAVILPVTHFETLKDSESKYVSSSVLFAERMQSLVSSVKTRHAMGMVHMDLARKNIGILTGEKSRHDAILYDNSYAAIVDKDESDDKFHEMGRFCSEPEFQSALVWGKNSTLAHDLEAFINVLGKGTVSCLDRPRAAALRGFLESSATLDNVQTVLEKFANASYLNCSECLATSEEFWSW